MPEFIYAIVKDMCRCILKNALYIPTFKQNIFSVQAATKNGAHISFECDNCQLIHPFGGHLYYLKNIVSARNATYGLHTWHKFLGHCNKSDIKKLPNFVKGMKIKLTPNYALNCDICIQGKTEITDICIQGNDRNKTLNCKATKILALVHSDLAGPIQP